MMRTTDRRGGAWPVLLFYGVTGGVVVLVAATVLYSWFARQMLAASIVAEPVPSVILVADDGSARAAGWVQLFNDAKIATKLVEPERVAAAPGILALCDLEAIHPNVLAEVRRRLGAGGGVLLIGRIPPELTKLVPFETETAPAGGLLEIADEPSPVLARMTPSHQTWFAPAAGAVLRETPQMQIDARWRESARAAIAHLLDASARRILWLGFDPSAMKRARDPQLELMLRTAMRWIDGQPVSDGAAGEQAAAQTLAVGARVEARKKRFAWSADRVAGKPMLTLRLRNGSAEALPNPAVRLWLPSGTNGVELSGSWFSRRRVTLHPDRDSGAVTVTLPALGAHEDRLLALRVTPQR